MRTEKVKLSGTHFFYVPKKWLNLRHMQFFLFLFLSYSNYLHLHPENRTLTIKSGGTRIKTETRKMSTQVDNNGINQTNNVNVTNMRITTVEALQAENKEIVFLAFNRDVTDRTPHVKALAKSIREVGLLTPLYLVPASTALTEGVELVDEKGRTVKNGSDKFVLTDGNNKYRAIQVLRKTSEPGKASEHIKCIIDEDAKDILQTVITMNNVVKPWSNADAIKAASKTKTNETIEFIHEKVKEGFNFSTISLILTGQKGKITKDVVMKHAAGTSELPSYDLVNAKKKLDAMKEAGFSPKFIQNRYLIEAINAQLFIGKPMDIVLEALKRFTDNEVQFAEDARNLSLLADKIREVEIEKAFEE